MEEEEKNFISEEFLKLNSKIDKVLQADNKKWVNYEEAAKIFGRCKRTIKKFIESGELKTAKIGGSYYFLQKDLDEFFLSHYNGKSM